MDEKVSLLSEELEEKFRGLYVEWLLDSLENEKQSIKIPYLVNGYINMMNNTTNDDLMLMFFSRGNTAAQMFPITSAVPSCTTVSNTFLTTSGIIFDSTNSPIWII